MSNFDGNKDEMSLKVLTQKESAELEKKQIAKLEKDNAILNKTTLEKKLKELDTAIKKGDSSNFSELKDYFENVLECLGNNSRKEIEIDKKESAVAIKESGVTALNLLEFKNADAKLEIYDYKGRIKEAINMLNEKPIVEEKNDTQEKRTIRKSDRILIGTVFGLVATIAASTLAVQGCNNKNKDNGTTNTTSSITDTNLDESTTTLVVTTSTGDYTVETVDPNYSSPTRETTNADSNNNNSNNNNNNNGNGNNGVEPDATTSHIRNTTPNGHESVISEPTSPTTKPVSNETTTVQTDVNGTQPGHTEPEVKPTGNDSLPVEPTRVTVDRSADPTPTPKPTEKPTEATTTTEGTTKADPTPTPKPATPTPKPATPTPKPVPVETVDPNDPDNVIEKTKAKKLALKLS